MCLTKLTRRIFCHVLLHIIFQLQFPGITPEKDLRASFLFTLCFLEIEQKSYRESGAKEISAKGQQRAVGLTPVANYAVMRLGEIRPYVLVRKKGGSEQCSQYGPGFSKKCTGMGENKQKHLRCAEGFSYEVLLLFLLGFELSLPSKGTLWEPLLHY